MRKLQILSQTLGVMCGLCLVSGSVWAAAQQKLVGHAESPSLMGDEEVKKLPGHPVQKKNSDFIFSPEELNQIGKQAVAEVDEDFARIRESVLIELANSFYGQQKVTDAEKVSAYRTEVILDRTIQLLKQRYPQYITQKPVWVWNNVGGVFARMTILFCSFGEYLALFGSPMRQSGFSGEYHHMDVYDIMLQGKMVSYENYPSGALPLTYLSGETSLLKKGVTRYYSMEPDTYMIDYGRGQISRALWQGVIAPAFYTSHDYKSMKDQLKSCGSSVLNVILQKFKR